MSEAPIDLLVLRKTVHRIPIRSYVEELRDRLPDRTIRGVQTPAEERRLIGRARVATGLDFSEELLDEADRLEWFACSFAGTDHLPLEAFRNRDVRVTNASGVHGPNIGEHVLGAILTFSRRFHQGREQQRDRVWQHYRAGELQGSTVTVIGLGAIGRAIARRLEPFGVHRIGIRHSPDKDGPVDEILSYDRGDVHDALSRSDYVVLSCPLTDLTRHLIDRETFVTMPENAVLVNIARGGVVHTDHLVAALQQGEIRGAALDVTDPEPLPPEHPLWSFSNVMITPHNAGSTPKYYERLADIVADNVHRLETQPDAPLRNQVN